MAHNTSHPITPHRKRGELPPSNIRYTTAVTSISPQKKSSKREKMPFPPNPHDFWSTKHEEQTLPPKIFSPPFPPGPHSARNYSQLHLRYSGAEGGRDFFCCGGEKATKQSHTKSFSPRHVMQIYTHWHEQQSLLLLSQTCV